jgi:HEAT repeat protein
MMSACAPTLAPGLLSYFPHPQKFVTRNLATVLGYAGPGYEAPLASVVSHPDLRVGREALRALAQIGSPEALDFVIQSLTARHEVAMVAEEVFWSFSDARRAALTLLADTGFASRHPALARRLLERAARSAGADLEPVATPLMRYRFHIWRPALVLLGLTAARVSAR